MGFVLLKGCNSFIKMEVFSKYSYMNILIYKELFSCKSTDSTKETNPCLPLKKVKLKTMLLILIQCDMALSPKYNHLRLSILTSLTYMS